MAPYATQLLKTPVVHSWTLAHRLNSAWSCATEAFVNAAWNPLSLVARNRFISLLEKIDVGKLEIVTPESETLVFGTSSELEATLHIKSDAFWVRVALFADIGFAEAFINGDVDCDDIPTVLKILISNRKQFKDMKYLAPMVHSICTTLTAYSFDGHLNNSRANISSHYDLGNKLFSAFLSTDMNYSSAIFKDYNGDMKPDSKVVETLEDGQLRKMRAVLRKVRIQPGDRVLEIGTGFAALSILAASSVPCTIDTITLSINQASLARKRISDAGLSDRITVHLMDFREIDKKGEWRAAFDRFISVEMIENVGKNYQEEYWRVVDWALKADKAIGYVQVISLPEALFPGSYIPSLHFIIDKMNKGSEGRLTVDSVYNIGPHYARTLREWKRKFLWNWESTIAHALKEEYDLGPDELEVFKRKWIYYFDYCEAGFGMRNLGDHCITFTRDGNVDFACDMDLALMGE